MSERKVIAVLFGGNSFEHDVSVLSAINAIEAFDYSKYQVIPIYISFNGNWYFGKELLNRKNYPFGPNLEKKVDQVILSTFNSKRPRFDIVKKGLFSSKKHIEFDLAFPIMHGGNGENGNLQGLLETLEIPYAGPRIKANAICMDKPLQKRLFSSVGVPVLKDWIIRKPYLKKGEMFDIAKLVDDIKAEYPLCAKPANLGSSVGLHKVKNKDELKAAVLDIFRIDNKVLLEPFIEDMTEYNVSVSKMFGKPMASVIEKPLREEDVLSFEEKYLKGKKDNKLGPNAAAGMVAMSREFDPKDLSKAEKRIITESAMKIFDLVDGSGAFRVDFYKDNKKGEIYLTEVNTIPGSLAYYLWEKAEKSFTFTEFLSHMAEEGFEEYYRKNKDFDLKSSKCSIF
jgi:D-alanine-D-alanine ligase